MRRSAGIGALERFFAGTAASVLCGLALFRMEIFSPASPWFQCVTVGALVAGVVALVRARLVVHAILVAGAFSLVQVGYAWTQGWHRAVAETISSLVLGGGTLLAALIFDQLATDGLRFGKFALLGPLVAGVVLAATSTGLVVPDGGHDAMGAIVRNAFVGLVVGDGVGLGVEIIELYGRRRGPLRGLEGGDARPGGEGVTTS